VAGMWRSLTRLCFALSALAVLVAGCGDSKSEKPPPAGEEEVPRIVPALDPPGMPRLRDSTLFELRYPAPGLQGGSVRLHAGAWKDSVSPDNMREAYVTMVAHGDLNGDSLRDAAVILYTDPGATGKFFNVIPVIASTTNQPEVLGGTVGHGVFLGDRVKPDSFWIDRHRVWLRLMERAKGDDPCCPTLWQQRTYRLVNDSLKLETTIPLGTHD
jgi:hypothetical protein